MATTYTIHLHETYSRLVQDEGLPGESELIYLSHSTGLSLSAFAFLAEEAFKLVDFPAGDMVLLHTEAGVIWGGGH